MKEHQNLRKNEADQLILYSKKSSSRLDRLSLLCNYGTTAEVQRYTFQRLEEQAREIRNSCNAIQLVIDGFKEQVDEMYPKVRFHSIRKYYRADEIERRFINARAPLKKILDKLAELRIKQQKVTNANQHNFTTEKVNKLSQIKAEIAKEEAKQPEAEAAYATKLIGIFQECQQLEKTRLDQIKQVLLDFIKAIHSSHYSDALLQNFTELRSHVTDQQDSDKDVEQWAQYQGIRIPIPSETNENNHVTTMNNQEN
jgi:hypothetical protein